MFALGLLFLACSCSKPTQPPPYVRSIELSVEDASCTEAWLHLQITDGSSPPFEVQLTRALQTSQTLQTLRLFSRDTLFVDEGLLPSRTYTYKAYRLPPNAPIDSSALVSVTTMDTSSGHFVFRVDTLGDGAGSVLYDVAIISEDNILAVGELYASGEPSRYNLAIWDGSSWRVERLNYQGASPVIRTVFAFGPNDVWLDPWFHWNGHVFQQMSIDPIFIGVNINKMWGSPDGRLYVVGNLGFIAERSPTGTWRRLESGTTLPIMDVYGARNSHTGTYEVLCVSADPGLPGHSQVLKIENMTVHELATHPEWEPWSIWFVPGRLYIHAGDGLWETRLPGGSWVRNNGLPAWFKESVRGQAINDAAVCGAFWLLATWNGIRWQTHFPRTSSAALGGVAIQENLLVAVGFMGNNAVVIQGRR